MPDQSWCDVSGTVPRSGPRPLAAIPLFFYKYCEAVYTICFFATIHSRQPRRFATLQITDVIYSIVFRIVRVASLQVGEDFGALQLRFDSLVKVRQPMKSGIKAADHLIIRTG